MCENGCGLWPWQEPLFWLSLFSTLRDFLQYPSAPVERGAGKRERSLTSCLLRLKTRLSLTLAENGTFRWDRGGLARASDTDRGQLAGSSSQSAPGSSSLPSAAGNSGSYRLWLLAQTEPRWAQTSRFSLTHRELCFYKSLNVTGNGLQMSYDVLHQNTLHLNSIFPE